MPKAFIILFTLLFCIQLNAQTVILQEDFSAGIPTGWQVIDEDGFTPHASVSQFTNGWINYNETIDTSVASTSYFADTLGAASDYLILPKTSLLYHTKLSWNARSIDASYPDGYYILISTTDSSISSFTDTIFTIHSEYFQWNRKSVILDSLLYGNQDVFIAFKHFTGDGFILELDDIWIEGSDFSSISENNQLAFTVYPNPTSEQLNIQVDDFQFAEIYALDGRLLLSSADKQFNIDHLSSGQYIIKVTSSLGYGVKTIIKQ